MDLISIYLIYCFTLTYAQDPAEAVVVNSCNRSVWYASVDNKLPPPAELLPGSIFRETLRVYPGPPLPGGILYLREEFQSRLAKTQTGRATIAPSFNSSIRMIL